MKVNVEVERRSEPLDQRHRHRPRLRRFAGLPRPRHLAERMEYSETTDPFSIAAENLSILTCVAYTYSHMWHDQTMLIRWREIDALEPNSRERILYGVDSLVRDAKARHAYRMTA